MDGRGGNHFRNHNNQRGWNTNQYHNNIARQGNGGSQRGRGTFQHYGPAGDNHRNVNSFQQESPFLPPESRDFTGNVELRQRKAQYKALMEKPLAQRLQDFSKLTARERLALFLPETASLDSLPPQDVPLHWEKKERQVIQELQEPIKSMCRKRDYSDVESGSESDFSEDGMYGRQRFSPDKAYLDFLDMLPLCQPLTIGFHAMIVSDHNDKWCYCPCGSHMSTWRKFVQVQDFIAEESQGKSKLCTFGGQKDPFQMVKHMEKMKDVCRVHRVMWMFLDRVFQDYHASGIRHIGFENKDTHPFKRAQKVKQQKIKALIDELQKEVEAKKLLEEKLAKTEEERKTLETVNRDMSRQLESVKEMKAMLKAKNEADMSAEDLPRLKEHYDVFAESMRLLIQPPPGKKKPAVPRLEVPVKFNLSKLFRDWYAKYRASDRYAFLFADFPERNKRASENLHTVISRWNVQFEVDRDIYGQETTRAIKQEVRESKAEDHGGPSREFLNQVWLQLGNLSIVLPDQTEGIKLYDTSSGGLIPQSDDHLRHKMRRLPVGEKEAAETQVRSYFRAIGRIVAHCLLTSEADFGPFPVPSHVLPMLYQSVLLRQLDLVHDTYCLGSLVDHACPLLDLEWNSQESAVEKLSRNLGIETSNGAVDENFQVKLRVQLQEHYIDTRKIALDSLENGLRLCGNVSWKLCFGLMPAQAVNQIAFCEQKITEETMFDDKGQLRFISFSQDMINKELSLVHRETQEVFQQKFVAFIRRKLVDDPGFLNKFVQCCTGMAYVPDTRVNKKFNITIEFNNSEMQVHDALPVIHTCDNTIKLPGTVYDANIETFEERLGKTMALTEGSFNMR